MRKLSITKIILVIAVLTITILSLSNCKKWFNEGVNDAKNHRKASL